MSFWQCSVNYPEWSLDASLILSKYDVDILKWMTLNEVLPDLDKRYKDGSAELDIENLVHFLQENNNLFSNQQQQDWIILLFAEIRERKENSFLSSEMLWFFEYLRESLTPELDSKDISYAMKKKVIEIQERIWELLSEKSALYFILHDIWYIYIHWLKYKNSAHSQDQVSRCWLRVHKKMG